MLTLECKSNEDSVIMEMNRLEKKFFFYTVEGSFSVREVWKLEL